MICTKEKDVKEKQDLVKIFEFEDLIMGLRADGIIHTYVKSEAVVNKQMQLNIIHSIIELKNGDQRKYPAIVEFGEFISIADDVVQHTELPFKDHVLSISMYAKNMADRILAKYYTNRFKTSSRFVIFGVFEEAVQYSYDKMKEAGMRFNPIYPASHKEY